MCNPFVVLLCLPLVLSFSPPEPFLGLTALHHPAFTNGRVSNQSYVHVDEQGRATRIEYHVEHAAEYQSLDVVSSLERVQCPSDERLTLLFVSNEEAIRAQSQFEQGSLVIGSPHWRCNANLGHPVIHRRVNAPPWREGTQLIIPTVVASYGMHMLQMCYNLLGLVRTLANPLPRSQRPESGSGTVGDNRVG